MDKLKVVFLISFLFIFLYSFTSYKALATDEKIAYLTFDDGPSENTDKILDILDKYNIKATFFVIGKKDKASEQRYKKIVEKGHTIALHSMTHNYKLIYSNLKSFKKDFKKISNLVKRYTGITSKYYRFPGGSSNKVSKVSMSKLIRWLKKKGITYFDWNSGGGDAVPKYSVKNIYDSIVKFSGVYNKLTVLMHDSYNKVNTVKALPKIIEKLSKDGYKFLKITDETKPIHHKIKN